MAKNKLVRLSVQAHERLFAKKAQFKKPNASDTIVFLADISDLFSESELNEIIDALPKSIGAILKANDNLTPQLSKLQRDKLRGVLDELDK